MTGSVSSPECDYEWLTLAGGTVGCGGSGTHFCEPRAVRAVEFVENVCVHTKSVWARKPFILEEWERDEIVRPLFGWARWDEQWGMYVRLFTVGWIELGRGNGKSEIAAAVVLLLLVGDDEESAEVYGAAKTTKQAGKVGEVVKRMRELSPLLSKRLVYNKQSRRLIDPKLNGYYEVIPDDAKGELGHNAFGAIIDEVLAQASPDLWDALQTAQGKRPWSLMLGFTTAGNDPSGFAASKHAEMMRILDDPGRSPHTFVYIRGIPKDDEEFDLIHRVYKGHPDLPVSCDVWDERNWKWANPALTSFLSLQTLRNEALEAKHDPTKENSFRQLRGNQWVSQITRYMPMHLWDGCKGEVAATPTWLDDKLEGLACVAGLDLSSRLDLTAWCLLFDDGWCRWRFWLPEDVVGELDRHTGGQVSVWVREGWITATDGDTIDYDQIYTEVEADCGLFTVRRCFYDKWSGEPVRQEIEKRTGLEMFVSQTDYTHMTGPMKELMRLVKLRQIFHGGNPVARWHADSLEAKKPRDDPDRMRPVKPERQGSGKRMDGLAALLFALEARDVAGQADPQIHGWPAELIGDGVA